MSDSPYGSNLRAVPEIGQRFVKTPSLNPQSSPNLMPMMPASQWIIVHLFAASGMVEHAVLQSLRDGTRRTISCAELRRGASYRPA